MVYEVRLDGFQGPLELLYQLVKKNKIEISEISLAEITEQYLGYLDGIKEFNLDMASEFMVVASELIEIKAKTLLPRDEKKEEEEGEGDLIKRLKEYHLYKKLSNILYQYEEQASKYFVRPSSKEELEQAEIELEIEADLSQLATAFKKAVQTRNDIQQSSEEEDGFEGIDYEQIRVEDKIQDILAELKIERARGLTLRDLINNTDNKLEVIVTFLSILELIKMGKIRVVQQTSSYKIYAVVGG